MRSTTIQTKIFRGTQCPDEYAFIIEAPAGLSWPEQLAALERAYTKSLATRHLPRESAVFQRFFLSDCANQYADLAKSALFYPQQKDPVARSVVQQPPASGAKIAMLAYHIDGALTKQCLTSHHLMIRRGDQRHIWSTRISATNDAEGPGLARAAMGTETAFADLSATLTGQGGTLRANCMRTWLFIRDVDLYYNGVVSGRAQAFTQNGFIPGEATIASTGINGCGPRRDDLVTMDAYSLLDLKPEQKRYLNAPDHMCPASEYAVSFERGTRIGYADRAQFYISGTASIDNRGEVVHPGDVVAQTRRAIENVRALLKDGNAELSDMLCWVVYLRDSSDAARVTPVLREMLGKVPLILTQAAVCRPKWLIECEGYAVAAQNAPELPAF